MKKVTLSSKNQIVIPSAVRKSMGLKSGDRLIIERVNDKEIMLKKEPSYYDLIGIVPSQKKDPVERIRELRSNWR